MTRRTKPKKKPENEKIPRYVKDEDLHIQYHEHDVERTPGQRMRVWRSDWFHDQFEIIRRDELRAIFHGVSMCGFIVRYVGTDQREIDDLVHPQIIVGEPDEA